MIALYLASTPLHFLIASSIAIRAAENESAHLMFIDQKSVNTHPYEACEKSWADSPFKSSNLFAGTGFLPVTRKLKARRELFASIGQIVDQIKPDRVYVGNDRRIEFQYIMQRLSQFKSVTGIYMDEGIFTYVGRKESGSFKDRIIDSYLKKIAYGAWWENPPTIGGSEWIAECYVAFPENVHPLLKNKLLHHLDASYFSDEKFKSLSGTIIDYFSVSQQKLSQLDVLITLPHESVMDRINGYARNIIDLIGQLSRLNKKIGIKYHPRNSASDILDVQKYDGVWLIPDGAAFECLLPQLGNCQIIGDMSSTLLTTRWLRPDLKVVAIENTASEYFHQFLPLFDNIGVEVLPVDDVVKHISSMP